MKQSYIICGKNGAGKGTLSHILEAETGGNIFRLSSIPGNFLKGFDIPETRENYAKMSILLRETFGNEIFLRAIEQFVSHSDARILIFDGPRRLNAVKKIQELTESRLIYIDAPAQTRYERIIGRSEKHDESLLTFDQFLAHEDLNTEKELESIREIADIVVENHGTQEDLMRNISHILHTSISSSDTLGK